MFNVIRDKAVLGRQQSVAQKMPKIQLKTTTITTKNKNKTEATEKVSINSLQNSHYFLTGPVGIETAIIRQNIDLEKIS